MDFTSTDGKIQGISQKTGAPGNLFEGPIYTAHNQNTKETKTGAPGNLKEGPIYTALNKETKIRNNAAEKNTNKIMEKLNYIKGKKY